MMLSLCNKVEQHLHTSGEHRIDQSIEGELHGETPETDAQQRYEHRAVDSWKVAPGNAPCLGFGVWVFEMTVER